MDHAKWTALEMLILNVEIKQPIQIRYTILIQT